MPTARRRGLCEALRADAGPGHVPVLILTSSRDAETRRTARRRPAPARCSRSRSSRRPCSRRWRATCPGRGPGRRGPAMSAASVDPRALHRRVFGRILLTALPSALVGGVRHRPGRSGSRAARSCRAPWHARPRPLPLAAPAVRGLGRARPPRRRGAAPGDAGGQRLRRLLELPRKVEVYSNGAGWLAGGLVFGLAAPPPRHLRRGPPARRGGARRCSSRSSPGCSS